MLINAQQLLQYQKCKRRSFLEVYGDKSQLDTPTDFQIKLRQDHISYQKGILRSLSYQRPRFPRGDWFEGMKATVELMQLGVDCIYRGVLLVNYQGHTLLSCPHLMFKHSGKSCFGEWNYLPASMELGKRPKQEYQVIAAFHAQILAQVQQSGEQAAWLMLRRPEPIHSVDLQKWIPQMQEILDEYIQTLHSQTAPEVFISRQRCSLCPWYSQCHAIAVAQKHLSLLPGVTPVRYNQLQTLNITTLESLSQANSTQLAQLTGFDCQVAPKVILQAQSVKENLPIVLPNALSDGEIDPTLVEYLTYSAPVEIYFDIEAQPDLKLNYLLGVLVVDRQANTEQFYSLLAEKVEDEELIWQQFLDLVWKYPDAPIYHFCVYEYDTVQKLAKLYNTPSKKVLPVLDRFVDVYEQLTENVALPVESYALKAIARWIGFDWRNPEASGAKCIYWYDEWLKTGDRTILEIISQYNEDDCRATRSVKDWLVNFFVRSQNEGVRMKESGVRSQESGVRSQESGVRNSEPRTHNSGNR